MPIAVKCFGYAIMIAKVLLSLSFVFLFSATSAFTQEYPETRLSLTPEETEVLLNQAQELLDDTEALQKEVFQWRAKVRELSMTIKDYQNKLWGISQASTPARHYMKQLKILEPELKKATAIFEEKSRELEVKMIALGLIEEQLFLIEDEVAGPLMEAMSRVLLPNDQAQMEQTPVNAE